MGIKEAEQKKKKKELRIKRYEDILRDQWDKTKHNNILIIG